MLAGYPVRVVRGEKYRNGCNIFGQPPTAERGLRDQSLDEITLDQACCVHTFGLNETRIERIDPDLFWAKLLC